MRTTSLLMSTPAATRASRETDRERTCSPLPKPVIHAFSGNQAALRRISRTSPHLQAKLEIGAVNDPLEAEADRVADHVMRMPEPVAHPADSSGVVQRKCAECEEEDKKLRPKSNGAVPAAAEAPPIVHEVLNTPGQPLDAAARTFFEPRFDRSLEPVRIHASARASESARAVGARAFTVGNNIVFGSTEYAPTTNAGRHLLAHELAHVAQQGEGSELRRSCGPEAIGQPEGCEIGDHAFSPGPTFRFVINCDDWADGADAGLLDYVQTIPATSNIEIHAYASVDGPESFNLQLACARAIKARDLLVAAGIPMSRITRVVDHGATPGKAADRRSVVIQPVEQAPAPPPKEDQPKPDQPKPDEPKPKPPGVKQEKDSEEPPRREPGKNPPDVTEHNTELGGLSMGNFDFHFSGCNILVWVWLKFQFSSGISAADQAAFKTRFLSAVNGTWEHTGWYLTGDAKCPCPDVPITIHAEESTGKDSHKVVDVEDKTDSERRPKVISDINVNLHTPDHVFAHEFGHVLGLYDEYDGGFFENIMFWHKNVKGDDVALMSKGTELRARYFDHYRKAAQKASGKGCNYTVSSPLPPGP